jgi:putative hydrolases of HD superfamily
MDERLTKQMAFALELDKQKGIGRQTYILNALRKENDAEHGWHLALMTLLLSEYSDVPIDISRTLALVIIHDVIEIDAGDTYAYDEIGKSTKRDREVQAANRIFSMLPKDQSDYFRGIWDEFEEKCTPESKFAHAMDSLQPIMLNDASLGLAWREHGVYAKQVIERVENKIAPASKALRTLAMEIIEKNKASGNLK